jgi:uncharacterized damage-inducible protein DinB
MKYEKIAEIYEANDKIRENLRSVVSDLTAEQANFLPEGEKWTAAGIMEHLATVEEGMTKISARLLSKAKDEGKTSDGTAKMSESFTNKGVRAIAEGQKFVAPEMVHPRGTQTIAESLEKMETNRIYLNDLRKTFEEVDGTEYTFPHPAFGPMTAQDWLILLGEHEKRHTKQIERILAKQ